MRQMRIFSLRKAKADLTIDVKLMTKSQFDQLSIKYINAVLRFIEDM